MKENNKEEEEVLEPVSPTGHYFNSSFLSISILGVLESAMPIDDSHAMTLFKNVFLPINPRFSSIIVEDYNGEKRWRKVDVNLNNLVKIPIFPSGMSPQFYDKCLDDYLSKLSLEQLPQSQPLWEIHIIKYPTSNASGILIFKIHHALGDGYSPIGALLLSKVFSSAFNTASDFLWSLVRSSVLRDDLTPIGSGNPGVEFRPISISTMSFSLDLINYKSIEEMVKPNPESPWGNYFAFLRASISKLIGDNEALKNTSMAITNMVGPAEMMALANHPVEGMYFMVTGNPQ
ncbi:hypothetical protein P3X46_012247, partial [Hevea brasiliensis]